MLKTKSLSYTVPSLKWLPKPIEYMCIPTQRYLYQRMRCLNTNSLTRTRLQCVVVNNIRVVANLQWFPSMFFSRVLEWRGQGTRFAWSGGHSGHGYFSVQKGVEKETSRNGWTMQLSLHGCSIQYVEVFQQNNRHIRRKSITNHDVQGLRFDRPA